MDVWQPKGSRGLHAVLLNNDYLAELIKHTKEKAAQTQQGLHKPPSLCWYVIQIWHIGGNRKDTRIPELSASYDH